MTSLGTSKAVKEIQGCYAEILNGRILCIDPSVGSGSSMPGYAIYEKGEKVDSGIIEVEAVKKHVGFRLQEIGKCLREEFGEFDVLVIEDIPPFRAGKGIRHGARKSHVSLLKSVGCIFGAAQFKHLVNIHPRTWQKWKDDDYTKSDHADAVYIGIAALGMAKLIEEKNK